MDIPKRIYFLCQRLSYRTLADIGTDHCYLPMLAVKEGKIDRAVAVDVNEGPLLRAKQNIEKEGMSSRIELRLGYGFSPIEEGECEEAVIAGMGGMLIRDILLTEPHKTLGFKQLILSPQSDVEVVRKALHELGLAISDEAVTKLGGKFYNIITASPGCDSEYSYYEYIFGKKLLERPQHDFLEYLSDRYNKNLRILHSLDTSSKGACEKAQLLREENSFLKGWIKIG